MNDHHYIGLDVHKKWIFYCVENENGKVLDEGRFPAEKAEIVRWCETKKAPWDGLMEATMFSAWIYDVMKPFAADLKVGHPYVMKRTLAAKNKSDRKDAKRFADLCRCKVIRTSYVMEPSLRALRRQMRLRAMLKRQVHQFKNRMAAVLMETGIAYDARKLHGKRYYSQLIRRADVEGEVAEIVQFCRERIQQLQAQQNKIFRKLEKHQLLQKRVELLRTIPGVGRITALTWALEVGDPTRFPSSSDAISYCGLVRAENQTAGKEKGGPLSKTRNHHLQHVLIEVGHLAPRFNQQLAAIQAKEALTRKPNVVAIAVARKIVEYLMAVDRSGKPFQMRPPVVTEASSDAGAQPPAATSSKI